MLDRKDGWVSADSREDDKREPLRAELIRSYRSSVHGHIAMYGEDFCTKTVGRYMRRIWWTRHGRVASAVLGGVIGTTTGCGLGFLVAAFI